MSVEHASANKRESEEEPPPRGWAYFTHPARYFGSITPGRTRQPLRFLAYSIRLKSIAASISCLLNAYSMQLQAGGDFDHKFDPSVDLVVVVSL
jgi:hypothetical protein